MAIPSPYAGSRRKLVLAFDVGTTFSGISYSILDPGQIPEIKGVTKFPAQEQVQGSSKIPSIIYYDKAGKIRAIGAETLSEGIFERAEEEGWIKVEWFKLHLRPDSAIAKDPRLRQLPPLPAKKTAVDVLADYLRYLLQCSHAYIEETHPNGKIFWQSVEANVDFVLSHPNGWEGVQQSKMRKAAVNAGLIPDTVVGQSRISFVTEGEASLHFAIKHGLPSEVIDGKDGVVIVDAGGGTIDISAYTRTSNPVKQIFEEISSPQCHFHGSIFVSTHLDYFLGTFLEGSDFMEDADYIVKCFDKTTKLRFRNAEEPQYIKFGSTRDNDPAYNIRFGQLKLLGSDVASFFEPSVNCIIDAVKEQRKTAHKPFAHIVFVGGFAASDWLYQSVRDALSPLGYTVLRPDYYVNKAVADGAVSYHIDHHVQTRISKIAYGFGAGLAYDDNDPEHIKRAAQKYKAASGKYQFTVFHVLLNANMQVPETDEIRVPRFWELTSLNQLSNLTLKVHAYRGDVPGTHAWFDENAGNFSELCTLELNLSHLAHTTSILNLVGLDGPYYGVKFDVILILGGVEMKVLMAWKENGIEKRSDAKILYGERDEDIPVQNQTVRYRLWEWLESYVA